VPPDATAFARAVKFDLVSAPLIIQVSGVTTQDIAIVVTPD
jgi:hypothetical protein